MPGYFASKTAEMPPRKRPSTSAYMGAVTGAHSCLKIVTIARMKPPIRPPHPKRPPVMPSGVLATLLHPKAAVINARTRRLAVFPTMPSREIAPPVASETPVTLPSLICEARQVGEQERWGGGRSVGGFI